MGLENLKYQLLKLGILITNLLSFNLDNVLNDNVLTEHLLQLSCYSFTENDQQLFRKRQKQGAEFSSCFNVIQKSLNSYVCALDKTKHFYPYKAEV